MLTSITTSIYRTGHLLLFTVSLSALALMVAPKDQLQTYQTKIEETREEGATLLAPITLRLAENELRRAHAAMHASPPRPLSTEHALEMVEYRIRELELVVRTRKTQGAGLSELETVARVRQQYPDLEPLLSKNESLD